MIGFIGGGNMAEALIKGITSDGKKSVIVAEPREERREYLKKYSADTTISNKEVVDKADIIILAVKPQIMADVLDEISGVVTQEKTVVSIAAGITLAFLQSRLKTDKIIRVMPNTPALAQEGMSVISLCSCLPINVVEPVRDIFSSVGKVLTLPEKQINAVTAVSGSGPAFFALFAEAMINAGEEMGLIRDSASELAIQTLIGTAKLLETGMPPQTLRKMVTSPGGTTAAGVKSFEENGLFRLVSQALDAAKKRAEELALS
ncbi:MAG TPA: pyrroline-5-carboxylate reductase [Dissulfurispiraceae bacterium]|nr:pyrroline-5-carboxylate reductase [Dissulfurispiraceae bacterium]